MDGHHINTLKNIGVNNESFTISTWVKVITLQGHSNIVSNTGGGNGFRFGLNSTGRGLNILFGDGTHQNFICGSDILNDNKWHHIVGVFDRKNNVFSCYINGKFAQSITLISRPNMSTTSAKIGNFCCAPGVTFSALIDDVRIYNQNLTLAEIVDIYEDINNISLVKD